MSYYVPNLGSLLAMNKPINPIGMNLIGGLTAHRLVNDLT